MKKTNEQKNRLVIALLFTIILFVGLIIRLVQIQIVKGEELKKSALSQWVKGVPIEPKRGIIYDRNGKKLAVSKIIYSLDVHTKEVKAERREEIAESVSNIIDIEKDDILSILNENKGYRNIKKDITKEEIDQIKELKIGALRVTDEKHRYYPFGNFASHLIGWTDSDNKGLYGIENTYNNYLKGKEGKQVKIADDSGMQLPFDSEKIFDVENGKSIVLTLDEQIQQFAESAVNDAMEKHNAHNITVLVMEPKTGDVLAMVNKPDYDLNFPKKPLNKELEKQWEELPQEEVEQNWFNMWRNYSINDIYEPGSTFKLITAAAALEENAVTPSTPFYCGGYIRDIRGVEIKCASYLNPHRDLNFQRGMDTSCNIVFVNTGRKLGKEKLHKYIKAFGFGNKSGIELNGEEFGLIPNSVEELTDVRLATVSYGHGIAITPIQLINSISAISNGGNLMKPRLVKEILNDKGQVVEEIKPEVIRKVISKSTSDTMLELMETVVSKGVGKNAAVPGYKIGGKTGTASKIIDGSYVDGKYIGSFVGAGPIEDPELVVLAIVDDPEGVYYGGTTAAPIVQEIFEKSFEYLNILPSDEEELEDSNLDFSTIPNLRGMTIKEAGEILKELGLKYMIEALDITSESIVLEQSPEPGITLEKGDVVDLFIKDAEKALMPDLIGKSKDEITNILSKLGFNYYIEGEGICTEQSPLSGAELKKEMDIIIKLNEEENKKKEE